jgi:glycosyltransferase involved in cell wall biosynthesis
MHLELTPVASEAPSALARSAAATIGVAPIPLIGENPYQRLLYDELARFGFGVAETELKFRALWRARRRVQVLHFHWPQNYYTWWRRPRRLRHLLSWIVKLPVFAVRIAFARALGYTIVWTIHEVFPHERTATRIDRLGASVLARASGLLLAHDEGTATRAARELGIAEERVEIVRHGSYIGVYPEGRGREEARAELGLSDDEFVFLCFGHVRAYKDVGTLLEAFEAAPLPQAVLLVAGLPLDSDVAHSVRAAAARDPRIRPLLEFIPDDRVADLFAASDAAVLPRGDGGTSGALILALSLGLPVVAAATPDYEALTAGETSGWLFRPGDAASMAAALCATAAEPEATRTKGLAARALAEDLSWSEIAERTAMLIERARGGRRG